MCVYKQWAGATVSLFYHLPRCPCCCLKLWSRRRFLCRCPAGPLSPGPDPHHSHAPLRTPTSGCSVASSVEQIQTGLSSGKWESWQCFLQIWTTGFCNGLWTVFSVKSERLVKRSDWRGLVFNKLTLWKDQLWKWRYISNVTTTAAKRLIRLDPLRRAT